MRILTARWVFPVARPPIRDGAVGIHAGRIVAVGRRVAVVAECAGGERWDLGEAALLPGLVNCHTHLEIGSNPSGDPAEAFVPWVQRLIESRKSVGLDEQARTAEAGAWALLHSGTTSVGEVSTTGQSLAPLLRVGLRGVVYREILGLDPAEAADRLAAAAADLRAMAAAARGSRLAIGLSPHSAYALSEELLSACGSLVRQTGVPPAIHAAESPRRDGVSGDRRGAHRAIAVSDRAAAPPPRRRARSPIAYLAAIGALLERPVLFTRSTWTKPTAASWRGMAFGWPTARGATGACPRARRPCRRCAGTVSRSGSGPTPWPARPIWTCGGRCGPPGPPMPPG